MKIVLIASGVILTTLGVFLVLSNPLESLTALTCSRREEMYSFCTINKFNIPSEVKSKVISLQDIREAKVERRIVRETDNQSGLTSQTPESQYRLVLILTAGNEIFPLTNYASSKEYELKKNRINEFLLASNETLLSLEIERLYTKNKYRGLFVFSIGVVALGGVVVLQVWNNRQGVIFNYKEAHLSLHEENSSLNNELMQREEIFKGKIDPFVKELISKRGSLESQKKSLEVECKKHKDQLKILRKENTKLKNENGSTLQENEFYKANPLTTIFANMNGQSNSSSNSNFPQWNTMTEKSGIEINAGGSIDDISGLVGGDNNGILNLGNINGNVTNAINKLTSSDKAKQPNLKHLLTQLQEAITADVDLPDPDKADLLEQVQKLAEVKAIPEPSRKETMVRQAKKIFEATLKNLPETAKIADSCSKLLPMILKALGFSA